MKILDKLEVEDRLIAVCVLIIITFYSVDLLTTIISIEYFGAYETIAFPRFMIDFFGLWGYILLLILVIPYYIAMFKLLMAFNTTVSKIILNRELVIDSSLVIISALTFFQVAVSIWAIINNIGMIFSLM